MNKFTNKLVGFIIVALFAVNGLAPIAANAAVTPGGGAGGGSSSPLDSMSILDQVRYFDRYRAFRSCVENEFIFRKDSSNRLYVPNNLVQDTTQWAAKSGNVAIGVSNDADEMAECKNLTERIMKDLGYGTGVDENVKFLEAMGFKPNSSPPRYEANTSFAGAQKNYDALVTKYLGVNPETLSDDGAIIYARALYTSDVICDITIDKPLREQTAGERLNNQNPPTIWYPNPLTKTVEQYIVSYDYESWPGQFRYFETYAGGASEKLCGDILKILQNRDYATAYQKHVNLNPTANQGGPNSSATSSGSGGDVADDCPLPPDTSMRWFGCSIMSVAKVATEALYGAIQQFLFTPTSTIFDNEPLKEAAAGLRNVALALVVVAGLVMVIAQASGSEIVDAYTIRKLLPRLGVAILGIALAWPLLRIAITLTNDIGLLADRILMGVTAAGTSGSSNDIGTNIISSIFAIGAAGGAWLFLGAAGLVSLAGTFMLALLVGVFVLAIRQLVIMVCVVMAPLAIAAYVLPGTQKLWGFWKNTLLTTLLMFPLIMFFLSSGAAFSAILGGANTSTATLLAVIVFIAPYFLLPFAFKLAGGLMSTIFSIANDKNRGMFDRLKKGRQKAVSDNVGKIRGGTRLAGGNETNWRGKFNRGIANTSNAPGAIMASGNTLRPGNWRAATRNATTTGSMAEIEKNLKENQNYMSWKNDDDLNKAAAESHDEKSLRTSLRGVATARKWSERDMDNAVARIQTVRRQMSSGAFQQMTTMQAIAGGTAYESAGEAYAAVARASLGDDAMTGYMVNQARNASMSAGRVDMGGAGFGDTLKQVTRMQAELRDTHGISEATQTSANQEIHKGVYKSQGGATLVHSSMKANAVKEMTPEMIRDVEDSIHMTNEDGTVVRDETGQMVNRDDDGRAMIQSLASLSAVYEGMRGSSPEKAQIMADNVMSQQLDLSTLSQDQQAALEPAIIAAQQHAQQKYEREFRESGQIGPMEMVPPPTSISYQQAIEGLRGNQVWQEMNREYQTQVSAMQARGPIDPNANPASRE